jgi:hypothetical protein
MDAPSETTVTTLRFQGVELLLPLHVPFRYSGDALVLDFTAGFRGKLCLHKGTLGLKQDVMGFNWGCCNVRFWIAKTVAGDSSIICLICPQMNSRLAQALDGVPEWAV